MLPLNISTNSKTSLKILCLGAHADDIEIGCGGTILRLLSSYNNMEIVWVVFGSNKVRATEAQNSAKQFLGQVKQKEIIVKSFRDGFFPYDGAKIKEFFEGLKRVSPDLIFTHHRNDAHQDHRLIAELTWNTFRDHMILEFEIPKFDGDLGKPTVFVPLDSDLCQRKVNYIMEAFPSQRSKRWFEPQTFLSLMRLRGMECNSASGYAEAFYSRKLVL